MSKILTVSDIDNNEDMIGKRIRLIKSIKDSNFKEGEIATCDFLEDGEYMRMKDDDFRAYVYAGEVWELVEDE